VDAAVVVVVGVAEVRAAASGPVDLAVAEDGLRGWVVRSQRASTT
jgi:hypothetical protein